jgi:hypothetical protein
MMTAKAPKGGIVSHVNGQFYEGGEFVPDTGLYCGIGKNRVSRAAFDVVAQKAASRNWTLRFNEAHGLFQVCFATGNTVFSARNLATINKALST